MNYTTSTKQSKDIIRLSYSNPQNMDLPLIKCQTINNLKLNMVILNVKLDYRYIAEHHALKTV